MLEWKDEFQMMSGLKQRPNVDPYVQQMIAGTNGRTYIDLINRLSRYPIPHLPVSNSAGGIFLDIGCGWGRWMVGAARRGYIPIGVDIKLEAALASLQVLRDFGVPGYAVVADLQSLPFAAESFDFVWSFSVIQHAHRERAASCVKEVARVLKPGADCKLEFPIRTGLWNRWRHSRRAAEESDYESWCVRYYTIEELQDLFVSEFGSFDYQAHCYFGIGTQSVDLCFVPWRFKPIILASLTLTQFSRALPPLKRMADSIYVSVRKQSGMSPVGSIRRTTAAGETFGLGDFYALLRCPISGEPLVVDAARQELIAVQAGRVYAVHEGVPVLLAGEARRV